MAWLKQNNQLVASVPIANLDHWLQEQGHSAADYTIELQPEERTSLIRRDIRDRAADTETLLGTTSDTSHLLLYGFMSLLTKLHTATSLAQVRQAAAPFAELAATLGSDATLGAKLTAELDADSVAALPQDFVSKVHSGQIKLPFIHKGLQTVIAEIEQRATAVAEVFAPTAEAPADQASPQSSTTEQSASHSSSQASSQAANQPAD